MAATPSNMIPLGTQAPSFELLDTITGKRVALNQLPAKIATVIIFICNHCPYVKLIQPKLIEVAKVYQQQGIRFIAINSNDVKHYPEDSPENMRAMAEEQGFPFPYLYDETQEVARAYQAACTPDLFIFDGQMQCVYRGRFDDATPGSGIAVTGKDLCLALDKVLWGENIDPDQKASVGCNIKWKK